jgi:D-alanine-D-alanine ligase
VLPIPEMEFHNWPKDRVRVVGHDAKWAEDTPDSLNTVRKFGLENSEPKLGAELQRLAAEAWKLFGMRGFARVDVRVSEGGQPFILEINPNPCFEPGAGFAAACAQAGMSYADAVEKIITAALNR